MRGFTLVELLMAFALTLMVAAGVVWVAAEADTHFAVQPEVADLSQRRRVAVGMLERELALAGAGPTRGGEPAPLVRWIPAIYPDRRWDAVRGVPTVPGETSFTVFRVPDQAAVAELDDSMSGGSDLVRLKAGIACASSGEACGFRAGQRALLFDQVGRYDLFTVTDTVPMALVHRPASLRYAYRATDAALVSQVVATTFRYEEERDQIRRSVGDGDDAPAMDQVVEMSLEYFGDPFPPDHPRPPPGQSNCLFDERGYSRLTELSGGEGGLVPLAIERFRDGPFCGEGEQRFDADLYRVRRVRLVVRLQVGSSTLRGYDALLFRRPGTSRRPGREVPDIEVRIDVSPRNLQG